MTLKKLGALFTASALGMMFSGCATVDMHQVRLDAEEHPDAAALISGVPFHKQKGNECGPAALAMLADYWGRPAATTEISRAIYLPNIRGSLNFEVAAYADRCGFWTRQYRGSLEDIRQKIRAGVPVLVLGRLDLPLVNAYHYWVLIGFDDVRQVLVAQSGTRANEIIRYKKFERMWKAADYWTLLACPPADLRWDLSAEEHNDLGVFFERRGALDRAIAEYRSVVAARPCDAWAHFNLGNALRLDGDLPAAVDSYKAAHDLDADNADVCNNLAFALSEIGEDLDFAVQLAQRAVQLRPAGRAAYLDTLACVYLQQRNLAAARTAFEQAFAATTDRDAILRESIQRRLNDIAQQFAKEGSGI